MGENAKCCARAHTAGREEKQGLWPLWSLKMASLTQTGKVSRLSDHKSFQSTVFALSFCSHTQKKKFTMNRPNRPETHRDLPACLPSAVINDMYYYAQCHQQRVLEDQPK